MSDNIDEEKKALILIVDDTPTNIQVLAESLRADYRVRVAGSGKAAFEIIAKVGAPDLILLDVMMPDMDGYEVCRRLKLAPETKNVPVIFVTAKADTVDEEYGLNLGAVDYIAKPFHLPIVAARVRNHINLKIKTDLLESQVMLDGLTNIPNRRRFDETLEIEWKRALRDGMPLSLIMLDIDYFKRYNDHYGHGVGDNCLKKVAASLAGSIDRPSDFVARYGGEEFVAILPDTDATGARVIAERFCSHVESMKIAHGFSDVSNFVTVSVGLASVIPTIDMTPTDLLSRADERLYQAKESGRNRVC
ncbi:MAG: PleD family two-component system response regulator [Gallionella sp.]|nr:PleD family two-component system response regulator [Gallionella sp.]